MNDTLFNTIRTSYGFSRSVTFLIVVAFVGLIAERTIYYTLLESGVIERENAIEKINRIAPHKAHLLDLPQTTNQTQAEKQTSNDTLLSEAVISVQDTLDVLAYELVNKGDHNKAQDKLKKLYSDLQKYDQQAIANFSEIEKNIEKHQLADVIKQRHVDMVTNYREEMDTLLTHLVMIQNTDNSEDKVDAVLAARKQLEDKQLKRSQQPFDPNNMPFKSAQPDLDNKPRTSPEEFTSAGLFNKPSTQYAALGDFTFDALPGASNPVYLAETDEVLLSQPIKDHAEALEYDPVKIYHWVRNNVEWQPTWGAIQDAELTLDARRGNAMDIASLTIALLRASQIPARYVHGTVEVPIEQFNNWAGGFTNSDAAVDFAASGGIPTAADVTSGQISSAQLEHVWVEAAIDYFPSRGAVNNAADNWVQMDPSYKQYEYLAGLDVLQISGIDTEQLAQDFLTTGTINEAEGWISGFDPTIVENAQALAQTTLEDYITNNLSDPTMGDVIGGHKTIVQEFPTLPSGLSIPIIIEGARYDKLPGQLQQQVTYTLGRDELRQPYNPTTFAYATLNNEKVTLSFRPATEDDEAVLLALLPEEEIVDISQLPSSIPSYLINVVPEFKVNGELKISGLPMRLGEDLVFNTNIKFAGRSNMESYDYNVIAGSYFSVNVVGGSVSTRKVNELKTKLGETRTIINSNDDVLLASLTREMLLGDLLYTGTLTYFAQLLSLAIEEELGNNAHVYLGAGLGTFGHEPKVNYLFGFPIGILSGGIVLDIPLNVVTASNDGNMDNKRQFLIQIGALSSSLEHIVPEQLFSNDLGATTEAISAVKALQIAISEGQRIYMITPENRSNTLPNINLGSSVIAEITASLNAGLVVVTHTNNVSVSGYTGSGYIIINPETGEGAYKISGGQNGAFLIFVAIILLFAISLFIVGSIVLATGGFALFAALVSFSLLIDAFFDFVDRLGKINNDKDFNELAAFTVLDLGAGLLPLSKIFGKVMAVLGFSGSILMDVFGSLWFDDIYLEQ